MGRQESGICNPAVLPFISDSNTMLAFVAIVSVLLLAKQVVPLGGSVNGSPGQCDHCCSVGQPYLG